MIKARKIDPAHPRILTPFKPVAAPSTPGERELSDRSKGQYKLEYEGKTRFFRNFYDLRWFVEMNLRYVPYFVSLHREDVKAEQFGGNYGGDCK